MIDVEVTTPPRRVFVYGSLRRAEYNHARVNAWGFGTLKHLYDGFIRNAELVNLGSYPAIVPADDVTKIVVGEVYEVPDALFKRIDGMEQGAGYEARPVCVLSGPPVANGEESTTPGPEIAYFYSDPDDIAKLPRVPSGDWSLRDK